MEAYLLGPDMPATLAVHIMPCQKWVRMRPVDAGPPLETPYDYAVRLPTITHGYRFTDMGNDMLRAAAKALYVDTHNDPRREANFYYCGHTRLYLFNESVAHVVFAAIDQYVNRKLCDYCQPCEDMSEPACEVSRFIMGRSIEHHVGKPVGSAS
jgi:hypothetical protein